MSFVKNVLTPIFTVSVIMGFVTWIGWLIYVGLNNYFPNFKFWLKYEVLKRKYDEEAVKWCSDHIDQGIDPIEAEKLLLRDGIMPKKVKEIMYIFDQVKQMKGGVKNEQTII